MVVVGSMGMEGTAMIGAEPEEEAEDIMGEVRQNFLELEEPEMGEMGCHQTISRMEELEALEA